MAAKLEGGAYLSSFVNAISNKLSSLLEDDSVLDSTLNWLKRLNDCLCDVEPVLDDAELSQFRNERVENWLVDLQDALYMADDLVDELSTKAATATPRDPGNSYDWSRPVDLIIDDSGVNAIENVVGKLESVVKRKDRFGLEKSAKVDSSSWRIPSTSLVVSSDVFGRDNDKENIIKLLLDDTCIAESPVTVIPIVGMGGIGKTTLAQLVYNDARVEEKFGTRAWVCVAENPDPINVTKTILGAIDSSPCNMNHFDSLQTVLKKKLTGKTFLVVLDDVWHDQRDMWEDFLKPFRYGNGGSKILLTTRSEKVASVFAANNLHYRLSLLSEEDCWLVFLKHSSLSTNSKQYTTLEQIGRKIVEKCKRLPLAVKTLGGLLRNKHKEEEWENILESEIWKLSEKESKILPALRVSYHFLPSHLKRCFVYCSLYPEDHLFYKNELILLWMAEGLLQPKEDDTLENIGGTYFDELVALSFFQPYRYNTKLFVMHDLIHDLATFFAGKFYLRLKKCGSRQMIDIKTRHLSYDKKYEGNLKLSPDAYNGAAHMRTILDFAWLGYREPIDIKSDSWPLEEMRCLRVLSYGHFLKQSLFDSIAEMIHLRYLNLSNAPIVTLFESICKLYNLQTLKLKNCSQLEILPSSMKDLVKLRHLDISGCYRLKEMPKEMSKLEDLNLLSDYIASEHEENGIRELGTMNSLHGSFCISNLEKVKTSGEASEANLSEKKHINTLELKWRDGDIDDVQNERDILDKLQPHHKLKELSIDGYRGETFPNWLGLSGYSKMTKLTLKHCRNCRELPSLGQLPSLKHLEITGLWGLEKIDFEIYNKKNSSFRQETPFKSLKTLKIGYMSSWREWHFPKEFDGFPQLRILEIEECPVLSGDLPAHLPALEQLTITRCKELACSLPRAPNLRSLRAARSSVTEDLHLPASLQYLYIYECPNLTFSEQLQHKSLTNIHVARCDWLTLFPLGDIPNLKNLTVSECQNMEYVEVPQALPNLHYLEITHCPSLLSLPALGLAAPDLQKLRIENCPEIDCFAGECLPPNLKYLEVSKCQKLARWITSKGLQSQVLTNLQLDGCFDVKSFPGEGCLPASLESLILRNFPNLETLHCKGLQHLTSLKYLGINGCKQLENITEENLLASIPEIYIGEECPLRRKLENMEDLRIQFYRPDALNESSVCACSVQ